MLAQQALLTFMARIDQHLVKLSQIPAAKSIVIAHQDLERIRRRGKAQRCGQRSAKLKAHIWTIS